MYFLSWIYWALILLSQNFAFTYVSRARSSGSLYRHLKASIFSNGIWIFSQMLMLGPMFDYLTGKHGRAAQIAAGTVYTLSTVTGSLLAHYWALRTEKGKNAVGANKRYAQIPVEEWEKVKQSAGTTNVFVTVNGTGPIDAKAMQEILRAFTLRRESFFKGSSCV